MGVYFKLSRRPPGPGRVLDGFGLFSDQGRTEHLGGLPISPTLHVWNLMMVYDICPH